MRRAATTTTTTTHATNVASKDQILMVDRAQWRRWLETHHAIRQSVWLVFDKKNSKKQRRRSIDYESAVLEALCFGWIDSKVQRIDSERYRQYFSKRKPAGYWNHANKRRVAQLEKEGLMTETGLRAIATAKENGAWEFLNDVEAMVIPHDLAEALASRKARVAFDALSSTKKQGVLLWIKQAKRATTRAHRIAQTADAAARGEVPLNYL